MNSIIVSIHGTLALVAGYLARLRGWRRFAVSICGGAASALSFAPLGIFPLFLLGMATLVFLLDSATQESRRFRASFLTGWAFGFGQFFVGLYWIGYAFLVDPGEHGWQLPFAITLFPAGLAIFPGLAAMIAARFWKDGIARIFILSASYMLFEWMRGHILTGFPWNLPAYGWGASLGVLQSVSIIGTYGLSLLTALFGASLAALAARDEQRGYLLPLAMTVLFAMLALSGWARLISLKPGEVDGVRLRIVQPNVPQHEQYAEQYRDRNWKRLMMLSESRAGQTPTHIIWPEAAPPFLLQREPIALDDIARLTTNHRVLLTGAVRVERFPNGEPIFHNSLFGFADGGALRAVYDKSHLVPFGEYLPLPELLHTLGLNKLVNMPDGFRPGPGPRSIAVPGAPEIGPLICYEIVFPGAVVGTTRPGWFVNVTDDSWFGPPSSSGPYQHLLIARVRAIEEGVPVVRAANTGISAIIDPLGQLKGELGAGEMGILDGSLPRALPPTLFARIGDLPFWLLLMLSIFAGFRAKPSTGRERSGE
ncbi:MAG: apolipoprotein N-acyltransferase [Alphaproteobacteria bacterium]|nr:apolipoprotein N-acyltransferase [Alphaproteobacteria bacterium]